MRDGNFFLGRMASLSSRWHLNLPGSALPFRSFVIILILVGKNDSSWTRDAFQLTGDKISLPNKALDLIQHGRNMRCSIVFVI